MAAPSLCRSCRVLVGYNLPLNTEISLGIRSSLTTRAQSSHRTLRNASGLSTRSRRRSYSSASQTVSRLLRDQPEGEGAPVLPRSSRRLPADAPLFAQANAQAATEALFKECARQADYIIPQRFEKEGEVPKNDAGEEIGEGSGWWYETMNLTPTFSTWTQVTFVHLYMITVRLRYFPPSVANMWLQHLHDHFFWEAEHRMTVFHDIHSRSIRHRYLKDLYNQWRGAIGAYDEGIMRGDAVLGAAVWRNVWKAAGAEKVNEKEESDWVKIACVVAYMRRCLSALDAAHDRTIAKALVKFGNPAAEMKLVTQPSSLADAPFTNELVMDPQSSKDV